MKNLEQRVKLPCPLEEVCLESQVTGELLPSDEAIAQFYKDHDSKEDWHSEWKETDISAEYVREMIRSVEEQNLKM